jgi:hypothetical protein
MLPPPQQLETSAGIAANQQNPFINENILNFLNTLVVGGNGRGTN